MPTIQLRPCCAALIIAALLTAHPYAMSADKFDFNRCVAYLEAPKTANPQMSGSGFFVGTKTPPTGFLVTAAHVARGLTEFSKVVTRSADGRAKEWLLWQLLVDTSVPSWRYHPDGDVAILRIGGRSDDPGGYTFAVSEMLYAEVDAPNRDYILTMVGFPLRLGTEGRFSPITRNTSAASRLFTMPEITTKRPTEVWITEDPSVGGFSGAPIFDLGKASTSAGSFTMRKGEKIVGLVSGVQSDGTGGKFGIVAPAYKILELIRAETEPSK